MVDSRVCLIVDIIAGKRLWRLPEVW